MSTFYLVYQNQSPEPMGAFGVTDDLVKARYLQRVMQATTHSDIKIARLEDGEVASGMYDVTHVEDGETT